MRAILPLVVALAVLASFVASAQHSVATDLLCHVTHCLSDKEQAEYAPSFNLTFDQFHQQYVMRSVWYKAPPKPKGGQGGVAIPPITRDIYGTSPKGDGRTPDRERPAIPETATNRKDNEIVVPLWMRFETRWKARPGLPSKACPHPIVRLQWRTGQGSGWYMPYQSPTTGPTTGGTGFPPHGELRHFTADYNNANAVVANMGEAEFEVRLWVLCGTEMFERVEDKDVTLGD